MSHTGSLERVRMNSRRTDAKPSAAALVCRVADASATSVMPFCGAAGWRGFKVWRLVVSQDTLKMQARGLY